MQEGKTFDVIRFNDGKYVGRHFGRPSKNEVYRKDSQCPLVQSAQSNSE
jgi:hypothetical protein